jgi:hypothetical protein
LFFRWTASCWRWDDIAIIVLATRSSTLVYWKKLHHFHTYQDEEMPRHSFSSDLGFYLTDMSSGIAGLLKVAQ